jgi:hypothetical protein
MIVISDLQAPCISLIRGVPGLLSNTTFAKSETNDMLFDTLAIVVTWHINCFMKSDNVLHIDVWHEYILLVQQQNNNKEVMI